MCGGKCISFSGLLSCILICSVLFRLLRCWSTLTDLFSFFHSLFLCSFIGDIDSLKTAKFNSSSEGFQRYIKKDLVNPAIKESAPHQSPPDGVVSSYRPLCGPCSTLLRFDLLHALRPSLCHLRHPGTESLLWCILFDIHPALHAMLLDPAEP